MRILLILFLNIVFVNVASAQLITYSIDSSLNPTFRSSDNFIPSSLCKMDVRLFENDREIMNTFDTSQKIEFINIIQSKKDTIEIIGLAGMFTGFGFFLDIFKNNCELTAMAKSDIPLYKLNKEDSIKQYSLSIPCAYTKVEFSKKPTFAENDIFGGRVRLVSKHFWSEHNGKLVKYKIELDAYFSTKSAKEIGKELDKMKSLGQALWNLKEEDKFLAGACSLESYSGCKKQNERQAYSKNIEECIKDIMKEFTTSNSIKTIHNIIDDYEKRAHTIVDSFKGKTDESKMNRMYFNRIRKILFPK